MPAERRSEYTVSTGTTTSSRRKAGSAACGRPSKKVQVKPCDICGTVVSRAADIGRHMRTHDSTQKLPCPFEGCKFRTLQESNLKTHIRRHNKDKSQICTDDPQNCDFRTCDKASLTRHRKRKHNYIPSRRRRRRKTRNSSQATPSVVPPLPSKSPSSIPSPTLFPFGEPSSSLSESATPVMPPEPQINRSHGLFRPTPSYPPGYQFNHTAEFQEYSRPTENFTSFTNTNLIGSTGMPVSAPTLLTSDNVAYLPLDPGFPLFHYPAPVINLNFNHNYIDMTAPCDYPYSTSLQDPLLFY